MQPTPRPIEALAGADPARLGPELLAPDRPRVLRGLVASWPMTRAGRESVQSAVAYLRRFAHQEPVIASVAPPEAGGRIFYDDDGLGFNFRRERIPLPVVLDTLLHYLDDPAPPTIYVASTTVDTWLPGFRDENVVGFGDADPLASVWIGNRTRIPAHQDLPDNLACVVAGRRRVTLFPPDQLRNLYVGPLDRTPAGQAISLVDFSAPDFDRFPRFAEALRHAQTAELEPGDAVLIPSMWWHHMEALEGFNVLINYWWRQSPAYMDSPMSALMLALLSVRDLPPSQRETWREMFRHYVFEAGPETADHIAEQARGVLDPMDEMRARELRARLLQHLNR